MTVPQLIRAALAMSTDQQPTPLDTLPFELAIACLRGYGDSRTADTQRYAPLTLLAKRYVAVGRALMTTRVLLRTRRDIRSFIAWIEMDPDATFAIERLSISATYESSDEAWRAAHATRGASAEQNRKDPSDEEMTELAELVDTLAQLLGDRVSHFELAIYTTHLPHLVGPSLRALTSGKSVRLTITGAVAPTPSSERQYREAVARLFGEARTLEMQRVGGRGRPMLRWPEMTAATDTSFGAEHFIAVWDPRHLTCDMADQMPNLRRLTLTTPLDSAPLVNYLPSPAPAFVTRVRHLKLDTLGRSNGFVSSDLAKFAALEILEVTNADVFEAADMPPSLVELHVVVMAVPAFAFAEQLKSDRLGRLRRISLVTACAPGWDDSRAHLVEAECERRGIALSRGPRV